MQVTCPSCKKQLKVADSAAGKRGKCPACQEAFTILRPPQLAIEPAPEPPQAPASPAENGPLARKPSDTICPQCDAEVGPDWNFCYTCKLSFWDGDCPVCSKRVSRNKPCGCGTLPILALKRKRVSLCTNCGQELLWKAKACERCIAERGGIPEGEDAPDQVEQESGQHKEVHYLVVYAIGAIILGLPLGGSTLLILRLCGANPVVPAVFITGFLLPWASLGLYAFGASAKKQMRSMGAGCAAIVYGPVVFVPLITGYVGYGAYRLFMAVSTAIARPMRLSPWDSDDPFDLMSE